MKSIIGKNAVLVLACLSLATVACGSDDEDTGTSSQPSGEVEIFSWWTSGDEVAALNALVDVYETKYPGSTIRNRTEEDGDQARDRLADRMATGSPPDTFQANIGADLNKWVLYNGIDDADSKVESLNDMAEANGWNANFPDAVKEALSFNGTMYGVAPNIHRINSLFYNIKIFADEGLTPPTTTDELLTVSEALKTAGYTPICIGSSGAWTLQEFVMEDVFPAFAGGDTYMSYWQGGKSADDPAMQAALDYMIQLWPYFNADANDLDWTHGIDHMFDTGAPGDADAPCVMTVMGDWAKGYLQSDVHGWVPGVDFEQIPFPGTVGTFVFTADSFPLPKGAPNRVGARALLEVIGSTEGQIQFNLKKGSIPIRADADMSDFDATAQKTKADFDGDQLVTALSGLLPSGKFGTLADSLKQMLADGQTAPVINTIDAEYSALKQ